MISLHKPLEFISCNPMRAVYIFLMVILQHLNGGDVMAILKDSGKKQEFETGAMRDAREGKGRYDLLPPTAIRRLALIYEKGAQKYGERNWEKGMPVSRFLDSALRHIAEHIEGYRDEDHLAQAMWNIAGAMHMEDMVKRGKLDKKLADLPNYVD